MGTIENSKQGKNQMAEKANKPKKASKGAARGSHQLRRTATRIKVLEAGIAVLHAEGYHAATTSHVAAQAGVSRGALLHQFRTRCELMLAVAEHVIQKNQQRTAKLLSSIEPGVEQFKALTDSLWEKSKSPDTLALIEIHMASRSNPELARGMGWRIKTLLDVEREKTVHMGAKAGIEDRRAVVALATLTVASIWGLSLLRLDMWGEEDVDDAYELLKHNRDHFIQERKKR